MTVQAEKTPKTEKPWICLLVLFSGLAALSWTVIWQIRSSLALGVSAWGTALTLAVTMGGMCIGAMLAGQFLRKRSSVNPLRLYGALEILIGFAGLLLLPALQIVEYTDTQAYRTLTQGHYTVHLLGIALSMGLPAICMGATTPVFGLAARQCGTSLSILYGLNTLGAALGSLVAAFILIPALGVVGTSYGIAGVNILVGLIAISLGQNLNIDSASALENRTETKIQNKLDPWQENLLVFATGFTTLALEVAWFRSFTAALWSTTASFAIMVSSVLLSLGIAAQIVPLIRRKNLPLAACVILAGIFVLLATPLVERFDWLAGANAQNPLYLMINWFFLAFYVTALPMIFLGLALPWVLDDQSSARRWGVLYGLNTLAAVLGSLAAGWLLLPSMGFAKTSWLMGIILVITGLTLRGLKAKTRGALLLTAMSALALAANFESGVGTRRVQMNMGETADNRASILASEEGPDATVSVVEFSKTKERLLIIDGFVATAQMSGEGQSTQYMHWMGHLPMLLHPDPKDALVICFGTGQTANALRRENPKSLKIVDINADVLKMAPLFASNQNVLGDPRVSPLVMDGRAFLRRSQDKFDVITLEPMPPTFAGVNALYSKEFYMNARERMTNEGVIAQWLPFHLVSPYHGASITRTFVDVFPNAVLWIDPHSLTGILLGSKNDAGNLAETFPGFERNEIQRPLSSVEVKRGVYLGQKALKAFAERYGDIVTDDNQILAYGSANFYTRADATALNLESYEMLKSFKAEYLKTSEAEASVSGYEQLKAHIQKAREKNKK